MKVKKGDQVKILSGKYRGKISDVVAVYPRTGKILVKDVNFFGFIDSKNLLYKSTGQISPLSSYLH